MHFNSESPNNVALVLAFEYVAFMGFFSPHTLASFHTNWYLSALMHFDIESPNNVTFGQAFLFV